MLTILESLNRSSEFLEKKGIESPRLNAELLLADILNCKRLDLYLKFDKPLSEEETAKYRDRIVRRGKYEPLQYITGKVEFAGLEFMVNPSVLIPRPETELLVEAVVNAVNKNSELKILDIGTGSGIIGISLCKFLEKVNVTAIDISGDAIKTAEQNAAVQEVSERIKFIRADIANGVIELSENKFDLIVSNPPYISAAEYETLQNEILMYEPKQALTDHGDGLNFYRVISSFAAGNLAPGGKLYFEIGKDQHAKITEIMKQNGFGNIGLKKDYSEIERVIYGEMR